MSSPAALAGARRAVLPLLAFLGAVGLGVACGGASAPPPDPEHTYTVAAEIVRLPKPDAPRREILLTHEAIPDFVDIQGERVGMDAMTMPFPLAPGLTLENYQPGDRVRATFVVRYHASPPFQITHLEKISTPP